MQLDATVVLTARRSMQHKFKISPMQRTVSTLGAQSVSEPSIGLPCTQSSFHLPPADIWRALHYWFWELQLHFLQHGMAQNFTFWCLEGCHHVEDLRRSWKWIKMDQVLLRLSRRFHAFPIGSVLSPISFSETHLAQDAKECLSHGQSSPCRNPSCE